jgi:hypothetical protein
MYALLLQDDMYLIINEHFDHMWTYIMLWATMRLPDEDEVNRYASLELA